VVITEPADLFLRFSTGPDDAGAGLTHHGLALAPGAGSGVGNRLILLPARFDGAMAAVVALVLPALAKLGAWRLAGERHPVTAKLASSPGWSELVLLQRAAGHWRPLAIGDAPLAAILAADGAAILAANEEGVPAGAEVTAIPWSSPFRSHTGPGVPR
jgi:molybdopterin biosynthesis enzyme